MATAKKKISQSHEEAGSIGEGRRDASEDNENGTQHSRVEEPTSQIHMTGDLITAIENLEKRVAKLEG